MQLIDNKIKLKDYIQVDMKDPNFDDTDNAEVTVEVTFSVDVANQGIVFEVYDIKSVTWSYTGVTFTDDENETSDITGASDDTWTVNTTKSKTKDENYGLYLSDVYVNIANKVIDINFEC